MADRSCTACRSVAVEPGFFEDRGEGSLGYVRWIAGPLQRGIFGGAKRTGKQRHAVGAYRCTVCGHLELYVEDADAQT
ncbi:hypothetical protein [Nocardioides aquiterrae]|uniref:Uncharacterized protein n=1 Tax=Nocardioides aquiterrae TaxID=203799 RepID=A0ABN1UTW6_9ACTN